MSQGSPFESDPRYDIVDGDLVMEWDGVLAMRADREGRVARLERGPAASSMIADKIARANATAYACCVAGGLALHASAVALRGTAIACMGDTRAGKSTMARTLCERAGAELLADDVLGARVDAGRWWVRPTEGLHWIIDGTGRKLPVEAHAPARGPAPLVRVLRLRFDASAAGIEARRLQGSEAFEALLDASMRFDRSVAACRDEMDRLADLAAAVPVDELVRPPRTPAMEVAERLMEWLEAAEGAP